MECNWEYKCEIWYESNENSKSYGPLKEWTKIKQINVKNPKISRITQKKAMLMILGQEQKTLKITEFIEYKI